MQRECVMRYSLQFLLYLFPFCFLCLSLFNKFLLSFSIFHFRISFSLNFYFSLQRILSADNANIYLLTTQKQLTASSIETVMHYSKYYLLTLQLTISDRSSKLFARSLFICPIIPLFGLYKSNRPPNSRSPVYKPKHYPYSSLTEETKLLEYSMSLCCRSGFRYFLLLWSTKSRLRRSLAWRKSICIGSFYI